MAGERSAKYRQEIQQVGAVTFSKPGCLSLLAVSWTGLEIRHRQMELKGNALPAEGHGFSPLDIAFHR